MKWRGIASQNSNSPQRFQTISRRKAQTRRSFQPLSKPNLKTVTQQSLESFDIDLSQNIIVNSCKAKAKAVFELQQKLKQRATQFISKIAIERMHQKGRFMIRKQQEVENRQIKSEIERYQKMLREEQQILSRRQKANQKICFFQNRAKQRQKQKDKADSRRYKTIDRSISSKSKNYSSENYLKLKSHFHPKKKINQELKNSIYLDQQQQKIEQTRKMLIHLSSMIQDVQKIRLKC